jgi:hypothetical protein
LARIFEVDRPRRFCDDRAGFPSATFPVIDPNDAALEPSENTSTSRRKGLMASGRVIETPETVKELLNV